MRAAENMLHRADANQRNELIGSDTPTNGRFTLVWLIKILNFRAIVATRYESHEVTQKFWKGYVKRKPLQESQKSQDIFFRQQSLLISYILRFMTRLSFRFFFFNSSGLIYYRDFSHTRWWSAGENGGKSSSKFIAVTTIISRHPFRSPDEHFTFARLPHPLFR